ncbi:uncharacterized protein LOC143883596 [Tasmannia lanceolata]|uniref:uncharacterized protein LOC143883596 n=1 Tax=Tasmannia lanceolata TaxID=3420 RepID=UPI004062FD9C
MFKLTHTKKNGQPLDDDDAAQFEEYETQHLECTIISTGIKDDTFSKIVGPERRGRVRTYGFGAIPTDLCGTTSDQMENRRDVIEANKKNATLETKLDDIIRRFDELSPVRLRPSHMARHAQRVVRFHPPMRLPL